MNVLSFVSLLVCVVVTGLIWHGAGPQWALVFVWLSPLSWLFIAMIVTGAILEFLRWMPNERITQLPGIDPCYYALVSTADRAMYEIDKLTREATARQDYHLLEVLSVLSNEKIRVVHYLPLQGNVFDIDRCVIFVSPLITQWEPVLRYVLMRRAFNIYYIKKYWSVEKPIYYISQVNGLVAQFLFDHWRYNGFMTFYEFGHSTHLQPMTFVLWLLRKARYSIEHPIPQNAQVFRRGLFVRYPTYPVPTSPLSLFLRFAITWVSYLMYGAGAILTVLLTSQLGEGPHNQTMLISVAIASHLAYITISDIIWAYPRSLIRRLLINPWFVVPSGVLLAAVVSQYSVVVVMLFAAWIAQIAWPTPRSRHDSSKRIPFFSTDFTRIPVATLVLAAVVSNLLPSGAYVFAIFLGCWTGIFLDFAARSRGDDPVVSIEKESR